MKVYFVTNLPFPNGMAGTNRLQCYAKAVLSRGVECKILIYVRTENRGVKRGNMEGCGVSEGIPFEYIGLTPIREDGIIKRKWCDLLDRIKLLRYLRNNLIPGDVVFYFSQNELIWIPLLIRIIHMKRAFFVKELCELPYGTTTETPKLKKKRELTLKYQFPLYDGVVSISDTLFSLAKNNTNAQAKHIKVPIIVDYNKYALPDKSSEADCFYIFHAGSMYEQKDGFVGMVEAFGLACKKLTHNIKFISTGNLEKSPHVNQIKQVIKKYGIEDDIIFTGYLNKEELRNYLSKSSLVIINKYETQQNKYCFSTKLAEYLAASKPVIITRVGEAMNWLEEKKNALIIEPHDVNQLAESIVLLFENNKLRKQIGKGGNILCQKAFRYEVYGKKMVDFFKSLSRN